MEYLILLLVFYCAIFIVSQCISNKSLISPSSIFSVSFIVLLGLSIACNDYFDFNLDIKTVYIMLFSTSLFVLIELIVSRYYFHKTKEEYNKRYIYISVKKRIILASISIIILAISLLFLYCITEGDFSYRMYQYKEMLQEGKIGFPRICIAQLYKLDLAVAYVIGYTILHNIVVCNDKFANNIFGFVIIGSYLLTAFIVEAARQPIIEFIVYLSIVYVYLLQINNKRREIIVFIIKSIPCIFILGWGFYKSMELAGRIFHVGKSALHYVAEYYCGGLYAFNVHINEPARSTYWGENSFADMYSFLRKINITNIQLKIHEFDKYGNTSTIFGRWYEDFGLFGVFIFIIITALIFSWLYYRIKITYGYFAVITYSFLAMALVWAGYDNRVQAVLSVNMINKLFWLYILYMYVCINSTKMSIGGSNENFN